MLKTLKHEMDKVQEARRAEGRNWFTMGEYGHVADALLGNTYYLRGRPVKVRKFSRANNVLYTYLDDKSHDHCSLWPFVGSAFLTLKDYERYALECKKENLVYLKEEVKRTKRKIRALEKELRLG